MGRVLVRSARRRRVYVGLAWGVARLGLSMQWWLTLAQVHSQGQSSGAAAVIFLSYFTVLANLLVGGVLTVELMGWWRNRVWRVRTVSAVAVYIAVVGAVYHSLLRETWEPQGRGGGQMGCSTT